MKRQLQVQVRSTTPGCFTEAQVAALRQMFFVEVEEADSSSGVNSTSQDASSLASLDQRGDVFVPSVMVFERQLVWFPGTTDELVFNGWRAEIDPTSPYSMWQIYPVQSNADTGVSVKGEPSGTVKVMPSLELSLVSATEIKAKLRNASANTPVYFRIIQSPIPPQKA